MRIAFTILLNGKRHLLHNDYYKKINKNWNDRSIFGKYIFELWNGDQPLNGWEASIDLETGIKMLIST